MKKINFFKQIIFLLTVSALSINSSYGQAQLTADFESGFPAGWSQSGYSTNPSQACAGTSIRDNMYSGSTTGNVTSPTSISNATDVTFSFDYKVVDWSAATVATTPGWGSIELQYSVNSGAFVSFDTINDANHVTANTCANFSSTLTAANVPMGDTITYRIFAQWGSSGDYYLYLDNISINQVVACPNPTANAGTNVLTSTTAEVSWNRTGATVNNWRIEYDTAGYAAGTARNSMVVFDSSTTVTNLITGLMPETDYDWNVRALCSATDSSSLVGGSFTTLCAPFAAPFVEDFTTFVPACWDEADAGNLASGPSNFGAGSWGQGGSGFRSNIYTTGKSDWAISPIIDLGAGGYELVVDVLGYNWGSTPGNFAGMGSDDTVQVVISSDNGATWAALYTWDAANPPASTSTSQRIDITALTGSNHIVAIYCSEGATDDPEDYYFEVDNFELRIPPACLAPTANAAAVISADSTVLSWSENGTATSYRVEWDTLGYAAGTARNSMVVMTDTFLSVNGLMAETAYDWTVQALCSATDSSGLVGNSFTTPCAAFTAPFVEDFTTFVPNCWDVANAGNVAAGPSSFGASGFFAGGSGGRINLYNTGDNDWLISPTLDFGTGGYELVVDVLGYDWGSTPGNFGGMGSDDTVQVAVSNDGGLTWMAMQTWDAANPLPSTSTKIRIDLTALTGSNHIVGLFATEGTVDDAEDYYFEIDKFELRIPPACLAPTANAAANISTDSADVSWVEGGTATMYRVEWDTAGYAAGTARNSVVVMNDTNYTITGLMSSTVYDWGVKALCSPTDSSVAVGNSFSTAIAGPRVLNCGVNFQAPIFTEEFDNATSFTGDIAAGNGSWLYDNNTTGSGSTGPSGPHSGSHYIFFETSTGGPTTGSIVSPAIDLSNANNAAELSFWLHSYGASIGTLEVGISDSATGPFTNAFSTSGQIQTDELDPYVNVGVNLDAYLGDTIFIEFKYTRGSTFTGDLAIDLFEILSCISCPTPSDLAATNIGLSSADADWVENGSATLWEVSYGAAGTAAGMGTVDTTSAKPFNISGLMPGNAYDYYVRAICGPNDTTAWSSVGSFSTLYAVPYTQDFEGFPSANTNIASEGWSNSRGSTAPDWTADVGGTGSTATGPDFDHTLGTNAGVYVFLETSGGFLGDRDTLTGPEILVGASQDSLTLSYWYHMAGATMGVMEVWVESNGLWDSIARYDSAQHASTSAPWLQACHRLNGYNGQSITLKFIGERGSSFSGDMAIDDISIIESLPCLPPVANAATNVTFNTADVSWIAPGANSSTPVSYIVEWDVAGFTPGSGANSMTVTADSLTLMNLSQGTAYEYNVRTICCLGDTSVASNTVAFTTPVKAVISLPITWDDGATVDLTTIGFGGAGSAVVTDPTNAANTVLEVVKGSGAQVWAGITLGNDTLDAAIPFSAGNTTMRAVVWSDTIGTPIRLKVENGPNASISAETEVMTTNVGWDTLYFDLTNNVAGTPALNFTDSYNRIAMFFDFGNVGAQDTFYLDNVSFENAPVVPDPYYAIGTINTEDANGAADSLNVNCFTSGIVTGVDLDGNAGISFTIIDMSSGTQEGITIFNFVDVSNYVVTEGDSIMVHGYVDQFRGLTQIRVDSIMTIATGIALPAPIAVTDLDETTEARWLSLTGNWVSLSTSGSFSSNLDLTNGTDTITMRIDSDTDVNDSLTSSGMPIVPGDTICGLLGIGGQFTSAVPALDGYQIFPMRWSDLTICRNTVGINENDATSPAFELVPNPTNGEFSIKSNGFNNATVNVVIRDLNGRTISNEFVNNANGNFNKSFNLNGESKGVYFISIVDGENVINKKLILQ